MSEKGRDIFGAIFRYFKQQKPEVPMRELEDQAEGKYITYRASKEDALAWMSYGEHYSSLYPDRQVTVSLLAGEGEKYLYKKKDGTVTGGGLILQGEVLLRFDGMCDSEGRAYEWFASGNDQFLNGFLDYKDKVRN